MFWNVDKRRHCLWQQNWCDSSTSRSGSGDSKTVASHVLVFYVVGLNCSLNQWNPYCNRWQNLHSLLGSKRFFWNRHAALTSLPQPVTRHHITNAFINFMGKLMKSAVRPWICMPLTGRSSFLKCHIWEKQQQNNLFTISGVMQGNQCLCGTMASTVATAVSSTAHAGHLFQRQGQTLSTPMILFWKNWMRIWMKTMIHLTQLLNP